MTSHTPLFERLRLQMHLRQLIQALGPEQALDITLTAVEKEFAHEDPSQVSRVDIVGEPGARRLRCT
jgi:hypothetical protein